MLERTFAQRRSEGRAVIRFRPRSFRAWSGAALSRYFHRADHPETPQPDSSRGQTQQPDSCSDEELMRRREQLQELLRQIDTDRVSQQKKNG